MHVAATLWLIGATPEAGPQTLESEPSDLDPATVFNRFTEIVRADLDRKIQLKSDGSCVNPQRIGTSQSATPGQGISVNYPEIVLSVYFAEKPLQLRIIIFFIGLAKFNKFIFLESLEPVESFGSVSFLFCQIYNYSIFKCEV